MRTHYYVAPDGTVTNGLSLSEVKKLMKKNGGSGYTEHFDRDGSFQECTPIVMGNNANTTYQAKYNTSRCYKTENNKPKEEVPRFSVDTKLVFNKVVCKASDMQIDEYENMPILDMLLPQIPDARRIKDTWLENFLCQVHSALYHEFRSMKHYYGRSKDIKYWKSVVPVYPERLTDLTAEEWQKLLFDEAIRCGGTVDNYNRRADLKSIEERKSFAMEMTKQVANAILQNVKDCQALEEMITEELSQETADKLFSAWFD